MFFNTHFAFVKDSAGDAEEEGVCNPSLCVVPIAIGIKFLLGINILFPEFPPLQKDSFSSIRNWE